MNISNELKNIIGELAEANNDLFAASVNNDELLAAKIMSRIALLEHRRNDLFKASQKNRTTQIEHSYVRVVPLRDQVIRALHLINRPAAGKLIADITKSRWNENIDTKKLSSLRRDETRSWEAGRDKNRRTTVRDIYIVPALTYDRFEPVRGVIALSTWQLADRLIAPLTPRVNMLKSTIALAKEALKQEPHSPPEMFVRLIQRLGSSIPGVKKFDSQVAEVLSAAKDELAQIETVDQRERMEATEKARKFLDEESSLFGGSSLKLVHGNALRGT